MDDFQKVLASYANSSTAPTQTETASNPLVDILTARLAEQGKGIATSASSDLQNEITKAMEGVTAAGAATATRLQSERQREVGFEQDRASSKFTTALEGRGGYATQVAGLRELTETTTKSIRDLDARYQEALMTNDANTATALADLRVKKLEFLQTQEQNFYSNVISLANLQQEAISLAQQNEQFWAAQDRAKKEFALGLLQSNYQFEKNYGLSLKDMDLKEQALELERERNQISWAQYNLQKKELAREKEMTNTTAMVAQDIRNKMKEGVPPDYFNSAEYLSLVKEKIGFDGDIEDLSSVVTNAYGAVSSDTNFMSELKGTETPATTKQAQPVSKFFGSWGGANIMDIINAGNPSYKPVQS